MQQVKGYLRLLRTANIVTAISDILAGIAIAGYISDDNIAHMGGHGWQSVGLLVLATTGLYGGGVVLNDVFDAELDKVERPERPIPSGLIPKRHAALFGTALLTGGVLAAAFVHAGGLRSMSVVLALAIAVAAVLYDKWGKHHSFLGPFNMGLCRGLNLLLGMSILPAAVLQYWPIGLVPLLYIAAITMISRGEVHGGSRRILYTAAVFYGVVICSILVIAITRHTFVFTLFFLLLLGFMIFLPLRKAIAHPAGPLIGRAVKAGVLALILMNAAWAAAFGSVFLAFLILLLLPLSLWLAKLFAVT